MQKVLSLKILSRMMDSDTLTSFLKKYSENKLSIGSSPDRESSLKQPISPMEKILLKEFFSTNIPICKIEEKYGIAKNTLRNKVQMTALRLVYQNFQDQI